MMSTQEIDDADDEDLTAELERVESQGLIQLATILECFTFNLLFFNQSFEPILPCSQVLCLCCLIESPSEDPTCRNEPMWYTRRKHVQDAVDITVAAEAIYL